MATARARRTTAEREPAARCVFCQISEEIGRHLGQHAGVVKHLDNARREILEAVREFADQQLDALEKGLRDRRTRRGRRGRRVTRIEVK